MGRIPPDGICEPPREPSRAKPWFAVAERSVTILTDPNPSQVMPIPFALCGGEFTNLAARMQKTPALDHSTRGFTKRYKSAGYRYGRRASHPKPVEEWASAAKFPGNSMPPPAPVKVSIAPEDSKLRAPPGAGRKVTAKSVVERQLSAGRHPDRSDCKRPNLAACDRCCKRQVSEHHNRRSNVRE